MLADQALDRVCQKNLHVTVPDLRVRIRLLGLPVPRGEGGPRGVLSMPLRHPEVRAPEKFALYTPGNRNRYRLSEHVPRQECWSMS